MNFIGRHLNTIGILLLLTFASAAVALYLAAPERVQQARQVGHAAARYICPMHPNVVSNKPGDCPECGMRLVVQAVVTVAPTGCEHEHSGCCSAEATTAHAGCSHEMRTDSSLTTANSTR